LIVRLHRNHMNKVTLLEALTAELLGDVGVLHDQIKDLRYALPELIEQAGLQAAQSMQTTINSKREVSAVLSAASNCLMMASHRWEAECFSGRSDLRDAVPG
jgi:hypothetical protein